MPLHDTNEAISGLFRVKSSIKPPTKKYNSNQVSHDDVLDGVQNISFHTSPHLDEPPYSPCRKAHLTNRTTMPSAPKKQLLFAFRRLSGKESITIDLF